MRLRPHSPARGGAGQGGHLVRPVDGRDEIVGQDRLGLLGREAPQKDDRSRDPGAAQLDPLLRQRHAEGLDPLRLQGPRHLDGAVAVGVGLHDGQDRGRPHALPHRREIGGQGVEVDLRPGRTVRIEKGGAHSTRRSSSSNRVYSRMNAMSMLPIGPLRCLAMMTFARPRFSSVGL